MHKQKHMFFFTAILCVLLTVLPQTVIAHECKLKKPTNIAIKPVTKKIQYDFTRSLKDIQSENGKAHNPYGLHTRTMTQGFMRGAIQASPSIKIGGFELSETGASCLWYEDIIVNIEIDPQIVIAKEVYDNLCLRRAVLGHEKKHIEVDRRMVNDFSRRIGHQIKAELQKTGFHRGFIPKEKREQVISEMQSTVMDLIKKEYRRLETKRTEEQRAIDTKTEYERVSKLCPGAQEKIQRKRHNDHYYNAQ